VADFTIALNFVLDNEDRPRRYNITTDNNGGQVVAGINSKSFPDWVAKIAAVPPAQRGPIVAQFYETELWLPMHLGELDSQDVANRVLDMETNAGEPKAAPELQRAINALEPGSVAVDGHVGPLTIAAANKEDPVALLNAFRDQRTAYYTTILAENPNNELYRRAWLTRAEA